ncbi:MAG: pantoate--beta-alanine ligase [bacterium]
MRTVKNITEMQTISRQLSRKKKTIGFVPTMGAIHEGHLKLIRKAVLGCDSVVVSIFLNPIQFDNKEDLENYPRILEADAGLISGEQVDLLFIPDANKVYPPGYKTFVEVKGITQYLCGQFRSGHFTGVATVLCKLLNIVQPNRVYLGQKDYQQTLVTSRLIKDLHYNIEVEVVPTVREKSGLALSSRNVQLSGENRKKAAVVYNSLKSGEKLVKEGERNAAVVGNHILDLLSEEEVIKIEYLSVCNHRTLEPVKTIGKKSLIAVAVHIEGVRLIDNLIIEAA